MKRILFGLCWVGSALALAGTLTRVHGHWLVKTIKVGRVEKL